VQPELRNSYKGRGIIDWSVNSICDIVKKDGGKDIRTMWIFQTDQVFISLLESLGFRPAESFMHYLEFDLDNPVREIPLPSGYEIRSVAGISEICQRSTASHAAFKSTIPFDEYCLRYERFMRSSDNDPRFDLVVVTPSNEFTSFCLGWVDQCNQVGLFEPVGTHPQYQHKGMGKAVLCEGLRRMKASGMRMAIVCAEYDNPGALKLYESVGFHPVNRLVTYFRPLEA
jgi:mycothiol synthase